MSRIGYLFALLALLFASASAETIVSDSLGNQVGLPLGGGVATGTITNTHSAISTSPYTLNVFVNNGQNGGVAGESENFFFTNLQSDGLFGNATLISAGFSSTFSSATLIPAVPPTLLLGSQGTPNNAMGLYQFRFTIPVGQSILVTLTYSDTEQPNPVTDDVTIFVTNPATVVGDPQFVGLRGQSFQVHGMDGAVYNIISEKNTQINSRFVFLTEGECPIINNKPDVNCWSHPGSYLGELSFQQIVNGKLHRALVTAGSAKTGFAGVQVDGKSLAVGAKVAFGSFSVEVLSAYRVSIHTENFSFELSNSDMFINQAVQATVPLSKLHSHGLLGQTHAAKVYPTATRYIEGEVDDYAIADNDIFGSDFTYNQFSA